MSKSCLDGRSTKWVMLLQEFDLRFVKQKSVKGHAITDFVAEFPTKDSIELREEFKDECALANVIECTKEDRSWPMDEDSRIVDVPFPRESEPWKLYFDGSRCMRGSEVGIVLISPHNNVIPMSYRLSFECTNNMVEYEAIILGLKVAIEIGISRIHIYS